MMLFCIVLKIYTVLARLSGPSLELFVKVSQASAHDVVNCAMMSLHRKFFESHMVPGVGNCYSNQLEARFYSFKLILDPLDLR